MDSSVGTFVSLVSAAGLGGVIGAYFQARFQHRATVGKEEHDLKQRRYLCVLILMLAKLDPATGLAKMRTNRPDLRSESDIDEELRTELMNAMVFAATAVLLKMEAFIRSPSEVAYANVALAMRKDLWGKRTALSEDWLRIVGAVIPR